MTDPRFYSELGENDQSDRDIASARICCDK